MDERLLVQSGETTEMHPNVWQCICCLVCIADSMCGPLVYHSQPAFQPRLFEMCKARFTLSLIALARKNLHVCTTSQSIVTLDI